MKVPGAGRPGTEDPEIKPDMAGRPRPGAPRVNDEESIISQITKMSEWEVFRKAADGNLKKSLSVAGPPKIRILVVYPVLSLRNRSFGIFRFQEPSFKGPASRFKWLGLILEIPIVIR